MNNYTIVIGHVEAVIDVAIANTITHPHLLIELLLWLVILLDLISFLLSHLRQYPTQHSILVNLIQLDVCSTEWTLTLADNDLFDT